MTETYLDQRNRAARNVKSCIEKMRYGTPEDQMIGLQALVEGMYMVQDGDSESIDSALHIGCIEGPCPDPRLENDPLTMTIMKQRKESSPTLLLPYYPKGGWRDATQ